MKATSFSSQAKEQAAMKADIEDMALDLRKGRLFNVKLAERTQLSVAALSMKHFWNAKCKKLERLNSKIAPSVDTQK